MHKNNLIHKSFNSHLVVGGGGNTCWVVGAWKFGVHPRDSSSWLRVLIMIPDEIGHMRFVTWFFYGFKISTKLLYSIESLSLIKPFINSVEASSYVNFKFIMEHLN